MAVMEIFVSLQFEDSELVLLRGDRLAELAVREELELEAASWPAAAASQARLLRRSGKFAVDIDVVGEDSSRDLSLAEAGERTANNELLSTRRMIACRPLRHTSFFKRARFDHAVDRVK